MLPLPSTWTFEAGFPLEARSQGHGMPQSQSSIGRAQTQYSFTRCGPEEPVSVPGCSTSTFCYTDGLERPEYGSRSRTGLTGWIALRGKISGPWDASVPVINRTCTDAVFLHPVWARVTRLSPRVQYKHLLLHRRAREARVRVVPTTEPTDQPVLQGFYYLVYEREYYFIMVHRILSLLHHV